MNLEIFEDLIKQISFLSFFYEYEPLFLNYLSYVG